MANTAKEKAIKRRNIIAGIIVVFLFLFVSFSYYFYQIMYTANVDNKGQPTFVHIRPGATYKEVMDSIENKNVIIDELSFRFMAKLMDYPELVKPGRYEIKDKATNYQLIGDLRAGRQVPVKVTFNNIRLRKDLSKKLAANMAFDEASLDSLLYDQEYLKNLGFDTTTILTMFIPNTYEFYWTTTPTAFMDRMKKEYDKFWTPARKEKAKEVGLSQTEVVTLASIVQAEQSRYQDECNRIAGVYLNRLKRNQPLEADPTVVYANGDFTIRRVLNIHLKKDSPYNTYKYKGLPPGPINVPSVTAIDAVLNPEKHNYYYFCAKEDFSGYHSFAETWQQHLQNARRYQKALNERKIMK